MSLPEAIAINQPNSLVDTAQPSYQITYSRQFLSWLAETSISFAFTSYQAGKLFLVGRKPNRELSVYQRNFPRCMGMALSGDYLYLSALYQIWKLKRCVPTQTSEFDCIYLPKTSNVTADLDIHDMVVDKTGKLIFVNTLFNCLATLSEEYSFEPLWKPPFISRLAGEDRCHLNGLCLREGEARYVTMASQTDLYDSWRSHQKNGGIVMDIQSNEVVCDNLSMPHSPRWYKDKLWILNSGAGYFGIVDEKIGKFQEIAFCPGYLRGLNFVGDYAIVGLSHLRHARDLKADLEIYKNLEKFKTEARCGIQVIHLGTGDVRHGLSIKGCITEIYDVAVLENTTRPSAIGFETDEIRSTILVTPK